ncbi:MAG: nicotinamide riboside transporter PnuC [Chitinophagales bacterium]
MEVVVVVLNLAYLLLILKEVRFGWCFGIAGSALFVYANIRQQLFMDALLNSYYVLAGFYGFYKWKKDTTDIAVRQWGNAKTMLAVFLCSASGLGMGWLFAQKTGSNWSLADGVVTLLSFLATWMTARKYLENWLVWLVANPLAMVLYYYKGGILYPLLFAFYTILAAMGYYSWRKQVV